MLMGVRRETLENGKVLRELIRMFLEEGDQHLTAAFWCLRDSFVFVPGQIVMSDKNIENAMSSKEGTTLTAQEDIMFAPDLYNADGHLLLPVFSSIDQMPEEFAVTHSTMQRHFFDAMRMALRRTEVEGIVIDVFTQPFAVPKKDFDTIGNMPTNIEDD